MAILSQEVRVDMAKKTAAETKKKELKSGLTTLFEAEKVLQEIANNSVRSNDASAKNKPDDSSGKILVGKYDPDKSTPRSLI